MPKLIHPNNRALLLETYRTEGGAAARKIAPGLGFKPSYVGTLAKRHGVRAAPRIRADVLKTILNLYETKGAKTTDAYAAQFGISPETVRKIAHRHKVRAKPPENKWRPQYRPEDDPRWARAIAIGPVLA